MRLDRRFLEIHPETPGEGRPISELGYPPDQWARMMETLERMGEAVKKEGSVVFEALNEGLFRAYFTEGRNIGDPQVLRDVAQAAGVPDKRLEQAWSDAAYEERLAGDRETAARFGITGIPLFILGGRWILEGAVPVEMLREAAKKIPAGKA